MNKETQDLLESIYQEISKACFYDDLGEVVYLDTIKEIFEGRGVPAAKLY